MAMAAMLVMCPRPFEDFLFLIDLEVVYKMFAIGPLVSEKSLEIVDGRVDDVRRSLPIL